MKKKISVTVLLSLLQAISFIACSNNDIQKEYKIENIHVNRTALTMEIGDKEQLIASAIPAVAHQPIFRWSSTDERVVTVTAGMVEAVNPGTASIIVAYEDVKMNIPVKVESRKTDQRAILYDKKLARSGPLPELQLNNTGLYNDEGLYITSTENVVKLDKFYALAERMVRYHIKLAPDAKAIFKSSEGDFNAYIDVPGKRITIGTNPVTEKTISFLQGDREYIIEIYHIYQQAKIRIIDIQTNEEEEVSVTNDGQGGVGKGALQAGFSVGMQWDHYCFGLAGGTFMLVKQITVYSLKKKMKLLMYGDSITQPEGYFPKSDFSQAWTQLIISKLNGNAMSSGRGGGQVGMVLDYIKNELPYIEVEYVMVTIGTNGGNSEENLSELVSYIREQGAIPILNNIPCNESGTQIENNQLIEQVRKKFGINGCKFDMATSLNGDGREVDKSMMYWEDYTGSWGWQIYHHPNEKGGKSMYERSLIDIPEIYK